VGVSLGNHRNNSNQAGDALKHVPAGRTSSNTRRS
jgi:hypothetical protein